jgi:hypothetical protein
VEVPLAAGPLWGGVRESGYLVEQQRRLARVAVNDM